MRASHAYFLFAGTLLTAAGYGATFLLTDHFRASAAVRSNTSTTLAGAMLGTLIGCAAGRLVCQAAQGRAHGGNRSPSRWRWAISSSLSSRN